MASHTKFAQQVDRKHREQYGQFFTHPEVARFMVQWILESGSKKIFDPAFGLGAFLHPVANNPDVVFTGAEIDPLILSYWLNSSHSYKAQVAHEDYLLSWGKSHDNIVCNPPYMRFQKFRNRDFVFKAFTNNLGIRVSGYTNVASAFLLKSLSELNNMGRLAYIMPLEFLNAGYGTLVKRHLIRDGHLKSVIRLDCEKQVFPDVVTSVGILLYDKSCYHPYIDFYNINSIASMRTLLEDPPISRLSLQILDPQEKWLPYFRKRIFKVNRQATVPLSHYGRFRRGIATGANEFFVLTPSRAKALGVESSELLPCLTRSTQVKRPIFDQRIYSKLIESDAPVLLFGANWEHSSYAQSYIRNGERKGYSNRFLTRNRRPWYKVERRIPSPILFGVFSRGPYKVIRNKSDVLNLTCFHGFYPNSLLGERYVNHLFLYLSSSLGRQIVSMFARQYGDSLSKFEPNDLNKVPVPCQSLFDDLSQKELVEIAYHAENTGNVPTWLDHLFENSIDISSK